MYLVARGKYNKIDIMSIIIYFDAPFLNRAFFIVYYYLVSSSYSSTALAPASSSTVLS